MKRINHVQQFFALRRIKFPTKICVWKRTRVLFDACVGAHKSHVQDKDFGGKTLLEPKQWAGLKWRRNENECKADKQKLRERWADGLEVWDGKYTETESLEHSTYCARPGLARLLRGRQFVCKCVSQCCGKTCKYRWGPQELHVTQRRKQAQHVMRP